MGYARVSTGMQDHAAQLAALDAAGVGEVIIETASGAAGSARPLRDALLSELVGGDVLVVWRLDRIGRSMAETVALVDQLRAAGVGLRSLTEAVDTSTVPGRMVVAIIAALAEMERGAIAERTRAGLAAARSRGAVLGRPRALDAGGLDAVEVMSAAGRSVAEIAAVLGVSTRSVKRARATIREASILLPS